MKALPERKGKRLRPDPWIPNQGLDESPSEKEGKRVIVLIQKLDMVRASMKALPKKKGNYALLNVPRIFSAASMKAFPKRKGNPAG